MAGRPEVYFEIAFPESIKSRRRQFLFKGLTISGALQYIAIILLITIVIFTASNDYYAFESLNRDLKQKQTSRYFLRFAPN